MPTKTRITSEANAGKSDFFGLLFYLRLPHREPCNLWPRSLPTGGSTVTQPGPRRGRRGRGAPQQPRAAPGPPLSPREERALESFGGEWRPEGAAAAAGRGRWRLVAPERRDWGGWAESGGGGRGRDGGRDRHGQ